MAALSVHRIGDGNSTFIPSLSPLSVSFALRQVVRFIGPTLKMYVEKYPSISRFVRADSGFANPELYKLIDNI